MPHGERGHPADDALARLALAEPVEASDAAHVRDCRECSAAVEVIREVDGGLRDIARLTSPGAPPIAPPPVVWERIAAATGVADAPRPVQSVPTGPVVLPQPRRRPRSALLVAVAAAALLGAVAGGLGTWAVTRRPTTADSVLASAPLRALGTADPDAKGSAVVVRGADGTALDLDVTGLRDDGGFLEVWLIDPTVTKMVPVGVLRGHRGEFTLPAGIDLRDYPIVDISVEPLDGNPAHSGDSVLRGTMPS
jgi:hypothetical protein